MQIKTVYVRAECCNEFDQRVNKALLEGWTLTSTQVLKTETANRYTMLYALLIRRD